MKKRYLFTPTEAKQYRELLKMPGVDRAARRAYADVWIQAREMGISMPALPMTESNAYAARDVLLCALRGQIARLRIDQFEVAPNVEMADALESCQKHNDELRDILNAICEELHLPGAQAYGQLPSVVRALKQGGRSDPTR